MRNKKISLFIVHASIVLLVGLAILLAAPAGSVAADKSLQVISARSDPAFKATTSVWTSERMRNAKPYPMPTRESVPAEVSEPAEPVGAPGLIPGGVPGQEYSLQEVMDGMETLPLGYAYPPPYTRYENFNSTKGPYNGYKAYPYLTVGVLFFKQNGIDYRASASSIGNYAVWTAGHCVSDGAGNWSSDFLFIPAYKDGSPPVWWAKWDSWLNAHTTTAWHFYGDLCRDMAGVCFNKNAKGRKVSFIGWLGFAWNWPRDQHWHGIGYPAAAPCDGNKQIICASSHSRDDDPCIFDNPYTMGTGCDQTGGCSGGPWIKNFSGQAGASNYLNGHFSYYYPGYTHEIFSPYFDDLAHSLWNALVSDTP